MGKYPSNQRIGATANLLDDGEIEQQQSKGGGEGTSDALNGTQRNKTKESTWQDKINDVKSMGKYARRTAAIRRRTRTRSPLLYSQMDALIIESRKIHGTEQRHFYQDFKLQTRLMVSSGFGCDQQQVACFIMVDCVASEEETPIKRVPMDETAAYDDGDNLCLFVDFFIVFCAHKSKYYESCGSVMHMYKEYI
eukprot:685904_1